MKEIDKQTEEHEREVFNRVFKRYISKGDDPATAFSKLMEKANSIATNQSAHRLRMTLYVLQKAFNHFVYDKVK